MKTSFYVSRGTYRQNIVFQKKIHRFRFFSRDSSDFWRDSLSWILNLPSTCPEEPLRGIKIGEKRYFKSFLGLGRDCVEILAEKLQQSFQNCFLRIQSLNSRKNFFFENISFFDLPGFRGIVPGYFRENVYAGLSNIYFTCSKECFVRCLFL